VDAGLHQSFLYNQTDAAEVKRGIGGDMDEASSTSFTLASYGSTVVTIAAPKAFEIRHRCTSSGALQGDAASLGTEVYMRVIVRAASGTRAPAGAFAWHRLPHWRIPHAGK
jgi:hypothetical protein